MDAYVFQAALYCEACGERLKEELDTQGMEDSGDSDDYPQGPYPEGGGESDSPQHCDGGEECANAERLGRRAVGAFLENPLTDEGRAYVEQAVAENPESEAVKRWADFYEIEPATFPQLEDTRIDTWFERDRAHVALLDSRTDQVLAEWWDEEVGEAVEDGFLDPRHYHRSAYEYARTRAEAEEESDGASQEGSD